MLPELVCPEKERLDRRYRACLLAYWEAATLFDSVTDEREFQEVSERAEGARLLFLCARAELQRHLEQHGYEALDVAMQ
jgi:hypothetical protein